MSKQLPSNANLKHLKNQARQLLDAHKAGDADACTRFKTHLPRLSDTADGQVQGANLCLRDAQLVVAREYGFASWPKLKRYLDELPRAPEPAETPHEIILGRIAILVTERTEESSQVLRRMLGETPKQVAVIMIALGQETTAEIMKRLTDSEVEQIAQEISDLEVVTTEEEDEILEIFEQLVMAEKYVSRGGVDYARGALEKALGERKAEAVLRRIRAQHRQILKRLERLVAEGSEDVSRVLEREDVSQAAVVVRALGEDARQGAIARLPEAAAEQIRIAVAEGEAVSPEEETEVLEAFEQVVVVLKYVSRGGGPFARGALEKAFGPRKAQVILDRATAYSGLLKLQGLVTDRIFAVVSGESPERVAGVLSQLEPARAIEVFNGLDEGLQSQVSAELDGEGSASPGDRRDLDVWLANRIETTVTK